MAKPQCDTPLVFVGRLMLRLDLCTRVRLSVKSENWEEDNIGWEHFWKQIQHTLETGISLFGTSDEWEHRSWTHWKKQIGGGWQELTGEKEKWQIQVVSALYVIEP